MIRRLRIKFIITNMTLITIVMITAFSIMYYNSKNDLIENSIDAMHDISKKQHGHMDSFFEPTPPHKGQHAYISTYVIDINDDNMTFKIEGFGADNEFTEDQNKYVNDLINAVTESGATEGVLDSHNMRFLCVFSQHGRRIILLDKAYEDETLAQLNISFIISFSIAFCLFLIISVFIAKSTVKPVEKSIQQQKQLIADMSHELKTPITVISTNTDILLSHPYSTIEKEMKWLEYIKDETGRMAELISSMMYLAKTDEAETKPELKEIDLSAIAYETALSFESVCFENKKAFKIDIMPNLHIMADEISIKQLLFILLDNAVKYSNDNGKISLMVETYSDKALLSVFNTGEPIPEESLTLIFERFYRIDKARSRDKGGSGLGLSIAKRIIENNEANISVVSNKEHGTTFKCVFKLAKHKKKNI